MNNTTQSLAPTEVQSVTLTCPDVPPGLGYLLVVELANGSVHVSSTRFPARSVRNLERATRDLGGPKIEALYVSAPHFQSEKACRLLKKMLVEQKKCLELDWVLREAHALLSVKLLR